MYEGNKVYDLLLEINRTYKLLILNHMEREQEIFSDEMRKITKINTDYIDLDNKKINILIVRDFNYQQELDDIVRKQLELSKERNNIMIGARKRNNDNKMIRFYEDEKELWTLYQKIYRTVNTRNKSQTVEIKFEQILPQPISPSLPKIKNN